MIRFISLTILAVGLSLLVVGVIGGELDPIEKSYTYEFRPRSIARFSKVLSLNSGEVHISIISDANAKITIYKETFNLGMEEIIDKYVTGYESLKFSNFYPTNYYLEIELLPVGEELKNGTDPPKFLIGIVVYPNSNYGFIFGSIFTAIGVVLYKIDPRRILLRLRKILNSIF